MSKKKDRLTSWVLVLIFVAGLSLLLYPTVSNYVNSKHQSRAINDYTEAVSAIDVEKATDILRSAEEYNAKIAGRTNAYHFSEEQKLLYENELNAAGNGVMGYIVIPSIDVTLPIYHGTSDAVLQIGVGHLEWTALPVGGEGSHCVLSGHRGLPSSKLFTNLDRVTEGEVFLLRVLDEIYTYQVDQILIVEPEVTDPLLPEEGKDYCTLVTCTPYGINTHRLLVRGHRIENAAEAQLITITAEAVQVEEMIVACAVSIPLLILFMTAVFARKPGKSRKQTGGNMI